MQLATLVPRRSGWRERYPRSEGLSVEEEACHGIKGTAFLKVRKCLPGTERLAGKGKEKGFLKDVSWFWKEEAS